VTTTHKHDEARRRLDVASLLLVISGVLSALFSCWLITDENVSVLVIIPSVVVAIFGIAHITKREAPHR
jgi:hypothetical protein